jgi:hypothetical protein
MRITEFVAMTAKPPGTGPCRQQPDYGARNAPHITHVLKQSHGRTDVSVRNFDGLKTTLILGE